MPKFRLPPLQRLLKLMAVLLIGKVSISVLLGYRDYFPANFSTDFLSGRESYFAGSYQWAFYAHIVSGPITLLLGLMLISTRVRRRFPEWHRSLGKLQIVLIMALLMPSGLWMARYAQSGVVAGWGFAALAVATGWCAAYGWRSAVNRRFDEHRRWMLRCFLLLCSAVVLRVIGGLATVTELDADWTYPLAAWVSWLAPLGVFELYEAVQRSTHRAGMRSNRQSAAPSWTSSLPAMEINALRTEAGVSSSRTRAPPSTNRP